MSGRIRERVDRPHPHGDSVPTRVVLQAKDADHSAKREGGAQLSASYSCRFRGRSPGFGPQILRQFLHRARIRSDFLPLHPSRHFALSARHGWSHMPRLHSRQREQSESLLHRPHVGCCGETSRAQCWACAHTASGRPWSVDVVVAFADEPRAIAFEPLDRLAVSGSAAASRMDGCITDAEREPYRAQIS